MADKFGDLVRRQRLAAGLTQAELAERTGLSIRSIGDLERGVTQPRSSSKQLLKRVLELPAEPGPASKPALQVAPRQLPAAVPDFTGRQAELATLTSLLGEPVAMVIAAIGGTAGVGKTALALHWAHQIADRFPDGQLYVNLRGYDTRPGVTAGEALASFLRGLGVPGNALPPGTEERAALYRTMLAERRMLIVLDNAAELDQLRPLLPGSPTCAVLVTSRGSLSGLVARDGARRLDLDPLSDPDAVELLRTLIGARVRAAPGAAARLAAQCSRLPLALRIAAELAVARPASDLADLVSELAAARLDLLDTGQDPYTAIRAVFSWSLANLNESTGRVFRLISLHPGADVDSHAAAALTGLTPTEAGRELDRLARAHLVQLTRPGRYFMHDLLHAYALELTQQDTQAQRQAARTRLFDHYLCAILAAMDTLYPIEGNRRPKVSTPAWFVPPALETAELARDWLDAERASFAPVVESAFADGSPDRAIKLASALFRYFEMCGYYPEAEQAHRCAYQAALETGDLPAQADALASLGAAEIWQGMLTEAIDHLEHALAISQRADDVLVESKSLNILGLAELLYGRIEQATEHEEAALVLCRQLADYSGEWRTMTNLADLAKQQGHYERAIDLHQQALALCERIGDPVGGGYQLGGLSSIYWRQNRLDEAITTLTGALALYRQAKDGRAVTAALCFLAGMHLDRGDHDLASSLSRAAVAAARQLGDVSAFSDPLHQLADILLVTGNVRAADELRIRLSQVKQRSGVPAQDRE
jgi:tetratricopeptide (TPR) repeat protein/transcriptional regulator with XRE-family HTH domain